MRGVIAGLLATLAAAPAMAQSIDHGRQLAEARCAGCHAIGPSGASPAATAPAFRDLHKRYPVEQLAEALAEGIFTGHPEMPVVTFDEQQVASLIAFLQSLQR
jgi:mono/diheme cytochrome c family protein